MYKTKLLLSLIVTITLSAIVAMTPEKSSSGAPASHTGAPGEKNCTTSGCHDDHDINSGTAQLKIEVGSISQYEPGKTYPVKVSISDADVVRFGFQIVALTNNNSVAGKFSLTDTYRTQFIKNLDQFTDRQYVTYSYDGTDAVSTGLGEWTMNWTAPSTNVGPVTFYAAGVSANDDESDKGDFVYTTSSKIDAQ